MKIRPEIGQWAINPAMYEKIGGITEKKFNIHANGHGIALTPLRGLYGPEI
jgi:hypothetical protein